MLTYPASIPLSRAHLAHLAGLLRRHRVAIGSRWRKLPPGRQALLVLAHLRNGDCYARLAAGFGIGVATVFRYVREAVDLLAARAPSLTAATWQLARNGHQLGLLDGTLISTDRLSGSGNRLYYSGKHKRHGVNLQALTDPRRGDLVWVSAGLPGSTHDLTAARAHGVLAAATRAAVELYVDKGYQGAGGTVTTPHKGRGLASKQKRHNRMINQLRGPAERGFATLKTWRIFTNIRCCPRRVDPLAQAMLALELDATK